jgi:hypothetical protein
VDHHNVSLSNERDGVIPMILKSKSGHSSTSDDDSDDDENKVDLIEIDSKRFFEAIQISTFKFIERNFRNEDGRKKFAIWLFRLAEVEQNDRVSLQELQHIVEAIGRDGIQLDEFCVSDESRVASCIMDCLDFGKQGYLTKEEFLILADLIVLHYVKKAHEWDIGKYTIGRKIGQGAVGSVHLAIETATGEKKAAKIIPRGDCSDLSRLDTEIRIMLMLHHPNIVELEEVLESEKNIFFIMEV